VECGEEASASKTGREEEEEEEEEACKRPSASSIFAE
jgi:hypothetical protein